MIRVTLPQVSSAIIFLCHLDRVVNTLKFPDEVQLDRAKQNPEYLQDSKIVWKVNFSRFHREFRDLLIVQAVQRRIDASAGNLMRVMLTLMNETSPWLDVSHHIHQVNYSTIASRRCYDYLATIIFRLPHNFLIPFLLKVDIISRIQAAPKTSAAGADEKLQKYHDQYLKVLAEDRTRFCDKVGDAGGGQYIINVKHIFTELASATGKIKHVDIL